MVVLLPLFEYVYIEQTLKTYHAKENRLIKSKSLENETVREGREELNKHNFNAYFILCASKPSSCARPTHTNDNRKIE